VENNTKTKSVEPKVANNSNNFNNESLNRVSKQEKFDFNEDFDDDYYYDEFKGRSSRYQRHNRNNSNSANNVNSNSYNNSSNYNNSNNFNDKSRTKHENVKQRNYSSNKPQNRYQYEQQIPPRFLKKQQMLKKVIILLLKIIINDNKLLIFRFK
jgi:hypothetical protein